MNHFDIALLILAGVLVMIGMIKGLVRILIGIAALVAAFAVAARFHQPFADTLSKLSISPEALKLISYVTIFIGVIIAGAVAAYLVRRVIKAAMLGWADRLGGAALGLVAATLVAALLVLPMVAYFPASRTLLQQSILAPYVTVVSDLANLIVPKDLSLRYREGVEDLRRHWRGEGRRRGPTLSVSNRPAAGSGLTEHFPPVRDQVRALT